MTLVDSAIINAPQEELGDYLEYRGAVYGLGKEAFYADIDAVPFPTRYLVDCYPLVIVEALAYGVPSIADARGCIKSYLIEPAGYTIPPICDFTRIASIYLERWMNEPSEYEASCKAAARLVVALNLEAKRNLSELLSVLAGSLN